ncbi:uncharacterized protein AC631_04025 [Debaryomyces fabryi]|uniref:Uncharacterized protein n=1 Tax=Debaryomyces fabryi TaxID=58627 RepID=A0A0V1PVC2_9ASCO|nr:uncharacterized protein AC631_04025 [Debaryomyces fabryi]KSA00233.1 hypothetical protein AC631_04025 [Debaryomyces fabryi]CUM54638.1 unnamed protein product [Debaryomyces fabryi]
MSDTEESRYIEKELKQEVSKKKVVQPKSIISKKTGLIVNCVFIVSVLIFFAFSVFQNKDSNISLQSHHVDTNQAASYEYSGFIKHEGEKLDITPEIKYKRDSKSSSSSSSKSDKATKPLDEPAIRFLLVLGGFIVLNMVAICIHHLFLKATRSEKSYRTIEQTISPF